MEFVAGKIEKLLKAMNDRRVENLVSHHNANRSEGNNEAHVNQPWNRNGFEERVKSYRPKFWFAQSLTPLVCAQHGWVAVSPLRLQCSSCHVQLTAPSSIDVLASSHRDYCPWLNNPAPASFLTLPLNDIANLKSEFADRVKQNTTFEGALGRLEISQPRMSAYEQIDFTGLFEQEVESVASVSGLLASWGWHCVASESSFEIKCHICQCNFDAESFVVLSPTQKRRKTSILVSPAQHATTQTPVFDVAENHRPFCVYYEPDQMVSIVARRFAEQVALTAEPVSSQAFTATLDQVLKSTAVIASPYRKVDLPPRPPPPEPIDFALDSPQPQQHSDDVAAEKQQSDVEEQAVDEQHETHVEQPQQDQQPQQELGQKQQSDQHIHDVRLDAQEQNENADTHVEHIEHEQPTVQQQQLEEEKEEMENVLDQEAQEHVDKSHEEVSEQNQSPLASSSASGRRDSNSNTPSRVSSHSSPQAEAAEFAAAYEANPANGLVASENDQGVEIEDNQQNQSDDQQYESDDQQYESDDQQSGNNEVEEQSNNNNLSSEPSSSVDDWGQEHDSNNGLQQRLGVIDDNDYQDEDQDDDQAEDEDDFQDDKQDVYQQFVRSEFYAREQEIHQHQQYERNDQQYFEDEDDDQQQVKHSDVNEDEKEDEDDEQQEVGVEGNAEQQGYVQVEKEELQSDDENSATADAVSQLHTLDDHSTPQTTLSMDYPQTLSGTQLNDLFETYPFVDENSNDN